MGINSRNYKIISYDSKWPILFVEESKVINQIIGDNILEIQHIGSTAVPGMVGKNTIDILCVVEDIVKITDHILDLKKIGYVSLGSRNAEDTYLFEKEIDGERLFIVHFYPKNHPEIFQIIAIRDYLRAHPDKAQKYSAAKLSFFQEFPNDYSQYRKLKDEYMNTLKDEAIAWSKNEHV